MTKQPHASLPAPPCPPLPDTGRQTDDEPWIPAEGRDEKGRILPGFGGRKPGSKNRRSREALTAVQDLAPTAAANLGTLVRQMNFSAIRYVLDATLPALGRTVDLDGTTDPHRLIEAVTSGEISPTEFGKIAVGMKSALDASELKELKSQIDDLEALVLALKR